MIKNGRFLAFKALLFRFIPVRFFPLLAKEKQCLFGISVPKALVKKATKRNKIKRQIREILIEQIKKNPSNCGTFEKHEHLVIIITIRNSFLEEEKDKINKQLNQALLILSRKKYFGGDKQKLGSFKSKTI